MLAADCWLLTAVPSWERSRLPGFPHIRLAVCLTSVGGEGETEPGLHSADVDYESRKVHAVARTGWELSAHGEPRGVSLRVSHTTRNMTVLVLPALARAEDRHCVFVAASDDGALRIWTTALDTGRAQRTLAVLQVGTCSHALRIRPHWPVLCPDCDKSFRDAARGVAKILMFFRRSHSRQKAAGFAPAVCGVGQNRF